jgi:hypothetical protein
MCSFQMGVGASELKAVRSRCHQNQAQGSWLISNFDILVFIGWPTRMTVLVLECIVIVQLGRAKQFPNLLLVTPMLAKNVSGISHSVDMIEGNTLGSDGFTHAVKRQGHVAFMPA